MAKPVPLFKATLTAALAGLDDFAYMTAAKVRAAIFGGLAYDDANGNAPDPATAPFRAGDDFRLYFSSPDHTAWIDALATAGDMRAAVYDPDGDGKVVSAQTSDSVGSYSAQTLDAMNAKLQTLAQRLIGYTDYSTAASPASPYIALPSIFTSNDLGTTARVDCTTAAASVALPSTSGLANGATITIRKSDASANALTLLNGSTSIEVLSAQFDQVQYVIFDGAWFCYAHRIRDLVVMYTATGAVNIPVPPGFTSWEVASVGAHGGGGSGRRGGTGTLRLGGCGANAGQVHVGRGLVSDFVGLTLIPSTIGVGGAGGAAVTTDDTNGNAGTAGGATRFGAATAPYTVSAAGGAGGAGGTNTTVTQTAASSKTLSSGTGAAPASTGGNAGQIVYAYMPGGAAGGGITTGNVSGSGGTGRSTIDGSVAGGAAGSGSTPGGAGTNGAAAPPAVLELRPGESGGGGGAGGTTSAGGAGGNGGGFGGAGGGGGASANGYPSGPGGTGMNGLILVRWKR